jgi:hypothetical protein
MIAPTMIPQKPLRAGQAGVLRGCCFGLVLVVMVVAATAFAAVRVLAAPDLGSLPGGTAHGTSVVVIAATLAGDAATQLVRGDHAVVVLSERDLTVIAHDRNPAPNRFRNPLARIRNGDVVVAADTSVGPFGVTAVAGFQLALSVSPSTTQITAQAVQYQVGQLGLPDFVGGWFDPRGSATLNLTALFASNPALETLSKSLDCLSVRSDGVHVGFHRVGGTASDSSCT